MILTLTEGYPFGGEPFLRTENRYAPDDTIYYAVRPQQNGIVKGFKGTAFASKGSRNTIIVLIKGLIGLFFVKGVWAELKYMQSRGKLNLLSFGYSIFFLGNSLFFYEDLLKIISQEKIDINKMTVHSYWMHEQAMIGVLLKRKYPDITFVTRCHGFDAYEFRPKAKYVPFRTIIFNEVDTIFCVSAKLKEYLETTYKNMVRGKVMTAYLGTLDHGLAPFNSGKFRIISCSNLIAIKRVHLIIEALSLLDDSIQIEWLHIGDGPLRKDLETKAKTLLKENVSWCFMGKMDNERLMELYAQSGADSFITLSETEGLPVSILEAISFGIPVIATDVGGISEIVSSENGILLDPKGRPTDAADAILQMMNNSSEGTNLLRNGARRIWERDFNADINYKRFFNLISNRE